MYRIERRELTEQRSHGAAMLNIFHCNFPRFISTGYSGSLRQSHYDYAKEQFWLGWNVSSFPREITEAALAHVIGDKAQKAYRRSDALEKPPSITVGQKSRVISHVADGSGLCKNAAAPRSP